jgi:nucleoside-diphosphate-sugar epimerase
MTLHGKTILITGASGFLGGALTKHLAHDGSRVKALVRNLDRAASLRSLPNVEIVQGDITDTDRLRTITHGCDIVFHAAAVLNGSLTVQRQINIEGTRHVMQAAIDAHVQRIVHVSSAGAYGFTLRSDITEDMPLDPGHAPYSVTKAAAETVVRQLGDQHAVDYTIIRPGMIYGAGSTVWTATMFKIARRNPTIFLGNGSGSIQAIHIDDVIDMLLILAEHPAASHQTFNCTPDPAPTWWEYLSAYAALAGHDNWLGLPIPPVKAIARLITLLVPADSRFKDMSLAIEFLTTYRTYHMDKARDLLVWQPRINLHDGIQSCIPYLRELGLLH